MEGASLGGPGGATGSCQGRGRSTTEIKIGAVTETSIFGMKKDILNTLISSMSWCNSLSSGLVWFGFLSECKVAMVSKSNRG